MEFRLLGPLEVIGDDGEPIALGGPRPRALLTLLLLHPNEVVSVDRLVDGVWGEAPPASAQNALQVHVHALRGALGPDLTRAPGYRVSVGERGGRAPAAVRERAAPLVDLEELLERGRRLTLDEPSPSSRASSARPGLTQARGSRRRRRRAPRR